MRFFATGQLQPGVGLGRMVLVERVIEQYNKECYKADESLYYILSGCD